MTPINAVREALEKWVAYDALLRTITGPEIRMGQREDADRAYDQAMEATRTALANAAALTAPIPSDTGDLPVVAWFTDWRLKMPEGKNLFYPGGGSSFTTDSADAADKLKFYQEWDRVDWVQQTPLVRLSDAQARIARDAAEMERLRVERDDAQRLLRANAVADYKAGQDIAASCEFELQELRARARAEQDKASGRGE